MKTSVGFHSWDDFTDRQIKFSQGCNVQSSLQYQVETANPVVEVCTFHKDKLYSVGYSWLKSIYFRKVRVDFYENYVQYIVEWLLI